MLKKLLSHLAAFGVGATISAFIASFVLSQDFSSGLDLLGEGVVYKSSERAFDAYRHEEDQVAHWALEQHLETLKDEKVKVVLGDQWGCEALTTLGRLLVVKKRLQEDAFAPTDSNMSDFNEFSAHCRAFTGGSRNINDLFEFVELADQVEAEIVQ